jgi:hypothetical protein
MGTDVGGLGGGGGLAAVSVITLPPQADNRRTKIMGEILSMITPSDFRISVALTTVV